MVVIPVLSVRMTVALVLGFMRDSITAGVVQALYSSTPSVSTPIGPSPVHDGVSAMVGLSGSV